jgi:ribonuclease P protein component
MDVSFGPQHRLHDGRDYSRVFNRQQKAAGRHVVLLLRPRDKREPPHARVGVMIAAKTARSSVRRHQLKRWVRECFRQEFKEILMGHDLVVLFRNDPPTDAHTSIIQELRYLVPKALVASPQPGARKRSGAQAHKTPSSS